jgi:hypothetical protein
MFIENGGRRMRGNGGGETMSESNNETIEELAATLRTLWFDLPLAGLRLSIGVSSQDEFSAVAWKGYDAGLKLVNEFLVSLVKSPAINEIVANVSIANYRAQGLMDQVSGRAAQRKIASLQGQINSLNEEIEELRDVRIVDRPSQRRMTSVGSRRAKRETANSAAKPQLAVA